MARSLKRNFLYQATWQLLLILTPLITTPFLSRVFGASQVGVYSYTGIVVETVCCVNSAFDALAQ